MIFFPRTENVGISYFVVMLKHDYDFATYEGHKIS